MPVCNEKPLISVKGSPAGSLDLFRESDATCLEVGLVNNMPPAAREATERQFRILLGTAAQGVVVKLSFFTLPEIEGTGGRELQSRELYSALPELWGKPLDGLIVTGAEPRARDLKDEPFWDNLARVLDWAEYNTHSSIWSCLAAHAALLRLDGIRRRPLGDKLSGVFQAANVADHPLTDGCPARWTMPHSRWNDIPECALRERGYGILSRSEDAGVDAFVKHRKSLLLFFQGHPEYEADSLLLEYRRDLRRFLRRETDTYPAIPRGCFEAEDTALLNSIRQRALSDRREELLGLFPTAQLAAKVRNTWRPAAVRLYRNWLHYLCGQKERRLRSRQCRREQAQPVALREVPARNGGAMRRQHTPSLEIGPVVSSALPDVAEFLHASRMNELAESPGQELRENSLGIERRLQWLLLENPVSVEDTPLGYCLRDGQGQIRGMTLFAPAAFLAGDQRLLGLCSGSFFVEKQARSMGFYLLKKKLSARGYAFFFATTCNGESGELWKRVGASPLPASEAEYFLPLRLDSLIPALVSARTSGEMAKELGRLCGVGANPILRMLTRRAARLTVEPCQDWEKLAELARRHRPAEHISSDRSPAFLEWRYGQSSPYYPCGIYLFRDAQGNEGWFAQGNLVRGEQGQIRGSVLLDAIWPRKNMSFQGVFEEIVRMAPEGSDAVFFRGQPGLDYREYCRWIMLHRFPGPRGYLKMRKGAPPLSLHALDYHDNDFGAWSFRWAPRD